jgi:putative radical SAM enzyme (TIGR03279 family)
MSLPRIVAVAPGSPAARAGLAPGDEVVTIDGRTPRDVLEWRLLVDEADPQLEVRRGGLDVLVDVPKRAGDALGAEVHSSVFDRVRTCDNHCEFCFIYQLPKGMRRSLYLKDDDYRLSFLYGNFTTLTRFTEADLERVITEGLSPLHVSIHSTDPDVRSRMLKNRRGATSLRWLRILLDHGIAVHGQVVVCPGVNDGIVLESTLAGILDEYPDLASLCIVPLGISAFNPEPSLRAHTVDEARAVVDVVEEWQGIYSRLLGRRLAFLADEYFLLAERPFPGADAYEGFEMHEDGIGMARLFQMELTGELAEAKSTPQAGFFAAVDGAPAEGYRATRVVLGASRAAERRPVLQEVGVLTGEYGAKVIGPLLADREHVRVIPVRNDFFGGTTAVTGLLTGADLARVLQDEPEGHRYLLPDVCLSQGRFLDGTTVDDLPRPVEVVATDGISLRRALASA